MDLASRKSRAIFRATYSVTTGRHCKGERSRRNHNLLWKIQCRERSGASRYNIISVIHIHIRSNYTGSNTMKAARAWWQNSKAESANSMQTTRRLWKERSKTCRRGWQRLRTSGGEKLTSRSTRIPKTKSKYVHRRQPIAVTEEEVRTMEEGYEHKCDFYPRRLKIWRGMSIHRSNGVHNSDTTEGAFPLEDITEVFGHKDTRWFQVKCGKGWETGVGARQKTC